MFASIYNDNLISPTNKMLELDHLDKKTILKEKKFKLKQFLLMELIMIGASGLHLKDIKLP